MYYRHKKPITEEQPARILWYVCDRKERGAHSKMVVASSYLTEVHTGKGQELYRRFKHYGIYEWSDMPRAKITGFKMLLDTQDATPLWNVVSGLGFSSVQVFGIALQPLPLRGSRCFFIFGETVLNNLYH